VPADQADLTALANVAGLPALAFPLPAPDGGAPCSGQIIGPAFSEMRLIGLARALTEGTA
jgi:aspartyl-tRNA(Asn)/glutamyl-tRNA(Gln) amidotransferase subunit A